MKTALTDTISEIIQYDYAGGPAAKAGVRTDYWSDTQSTWVALPYVETRRLSMSLENRRYLSYSFMPPALTLDLQLNNFDQIFSTGSGGAQASILKKNLPIQCWSGYEFATGYEESVTDDKTTNCKFVHTKKVGSKIYLDITSFTGTIDSVSSLGGALMGTATYGMVTYGYPGYYIM